MYIYNGKRVDINQQIVASDGTTYPPSWFADHGERSRVGITEIEDPERKDGRFYEVQESNYAPYITNTAKPIDTVKDTVWSMIKSHRDDLQLRGVHVGEYWLHNDVKSRSQWERMANKAQILLNAGAQATENYLIGGQPVPWKTMTGDYVVLTLGFIGQVTDALELQEALIFKCAAIHEANMRALSTVEAIAAYDWNTGWPDVYEPEQVQE